ncbi:MAG: nicotinate phosphoribosyltransferase [Tepidisphaeraceae bacterium]
MAPLTGLYRHSLLLLTDLYQLTMACGYWRTGRAAGEAVFHLYFRNAPFNSGYTVCCGLEYVVDYLSNLRLESGDRAYLAGLTGNDGRPIFDPGFLNELEQLKCTCDVDAIPEGTVVFPDEPLVRVRGPIWQCQILETLLLNIVNFQTLIATKATRICSAARGEPVLEFGLRRAQGIDGAMAASRAAFVGGCAATSNVLAGKVFGIPVKGTHAHSWVMSFDDEPAAFEAYARALPNNAVFLVDTYDTIEGIRHAIETGRRLREMGHEMIGIRLDSGDMAYLSIEARRMLDEAGFEKAVIVGSNDLDERIIDSLKQQRARINVWGVGTRLVTAYDEPALGGVYKLGAVRPSANQPWQLKVKVSEQIAKTTTPGMLQVRRFIGPEGFAGDMIYDQAVLGAPQGEARIIDPKDLTRQKRFPLATPHEDLLMPIFRGGQCVYECPPIPDVRQHVQAQLAGLHAGVKRFLNPHEYPVGLESRLHELKTQLVIQARERRGAATLGGSAC